MDDTIGILIPFHFSFSEPILTIPMAHIFQQALNRQQLSDGLFLVYSASDYTYKSFLSIQGLPSIFSLNESGLI